MELHISRGRAHMHPVGNYNQESNDGTERNNKTHKSGFSLCNKFIVRIHYSYNKVQ